LTYITQSQGEEKEEAEEDLPLHFRAYPVLDLLSKSPLRRLRRNPQHEMPMYGPRLHLTINQSINQCSPHLPLSKIKFVPSPRPQWETYVPLKKGLLIESWLTINSAQGRILRLSSATAVFFASS
jgi:hypothetical protein